MLAFTTLISIAVALVFGMLPAFRAARDLQAQMHESSGSTGSRSPAACSARWSSPRWPWRWCCSWAPGS
ncbi:MAG: hypothetical protein R2708_10370 [Vicinamibacterales bacterium]